MTIYTHKFLRIIQPSLRDMSAIHIAQEGHQNSTILYSALDRRFRLISSEHSRVAYLVSRSGYGAELTCFL
jgi:hypothetical protein